MKTTAALVCSLTLMLVSAIAPQLAQATSFPIAPPPPTEQSFLEELARQAEAARLQELERSWNSKIAFCLTVEGAICPQPPGTTQTNPLLPSALEDSDLGQRFQFIQVPRGKWYDPPATFGFRYVMTSDSLFTGILGFPTGFDSPFTVSIGDISLGAFTPGNSVDFTNFADKGVSEFTVTGISPLVDQTNPMAFPIQLDFNIETASFDMYPITVASIPEPSAVFSLVSFGVLSLVTRRKRP